MIGLGPTDIEIQEAEAIVLGRYWNAVVLLLAEVLLLVVVLLMVMGLLR